MIRSICILIIIFSQTLVCHSQENLSEKAQSVELINWKAETCDHTFDPYRLKNRVTRLESRDGITYITVNFSETCCADFSPAIEFRENNLMLLSYPGDLYCFCICCFSISYEISGLPDKDFNIYFNDGKIELSDEHYATVEPTFELHKGKKINQTNKYGFREGLWIEFFKDGNTKALIKYPESSLYDRSYPEWEKRYSQSGKLSYYKRNDTTEAWFGDGEIRLQQIKYKIEDTTFRSILAKFGNRQIKEKSLERYYTTIFKSESDSTYRIGSTISDYVYKEEYYRSGKRKYLQTTDTLFTWYEDEQVKIKQYAHGSVEYNKQGLLVKKSYQWEEPAPKGWRDLEYKIDIHFYRNGKVQKIRFIRDEPSENGHYYWKWDTDSRLIEAPEHWEEEVPWKNIKEINVPPIDH